MIVVISQLTSTVRIIDARTFAISTARGADHENACLRRIKI
jgi:hypothetical protein